MASPRNDLILFVAWVLGHCCEQREEHIRGITVDSDVGVKCQASYIECGSLTMQTHDNALFLANFPSAPRYACRVVFFLRKERLVRKVKRLGQLEKMLAATVYLERSSHLAVVISIWHRSETECLFYVQ